MPPRKTKAQKRAEPFRKDVTRLDDKVFRRHFNEWWDSAAETWGRRWRPPVQEMGVLVEGLQDLPRRAKQDGALYFTRGEDGRMMQANLYTKGNVGETGEVTVAMIEERMRACPLLAAGSIMVPVKRAGGHASEYNVFCRTVLNCSLAVGFSIHGDKLHKKPSPPPQALKSQPSPPPQALKSQPAPPPQASLPESSSEASDDLAAGPRRSRKSSQGGRMARTGEFSAPPKGQHQALPTKGQPLAPPKGQLQARQAPSTKRQPLAPTTRRLTSRRTRLRSATGTCAAFAPQTQCSAKPAVQTHSTTRTSS